MQKSEVLYQYPDHLGYSVDIIPTSSETLTWIHLQSKISIKKLTSKNYQESIQIAPPALSLGIYSAF